MTEKYLSGRDRINAAFDELFDLRDSLYSAKSAVKDALEVMDSSDLDYRETEERYHKLDWAHIVVDELMVTLS